jgi:hypothetical protein
MTLEQRELADRFLIELAKNGGQLSVNQVVDLLNIRNTGQSMMEYSIVRENLISEGLIEWWGEQKYRIKLTKIGWEASSVGLIEYRYNQEQKEKQKNIHAKNVILNSGNNNIGTINNENISTPNNSIQEESKITMSHSAFWSIIISTVLAVVGITITILQYLN